MNLNNSDTQCQAGSMSVGQRCLGKRESGARPERSGHCERGERLQSPLCQRHEKAQPIDNPRVRKPAETIRCTASEVSRSPESRKRLCLRMSGVCFSERQTPVCIRKPPDLSDTGGRRARSRRYGPAALKGSGRWRRLPTRTFCPIRSW